MVMDILQVRMNSGLTKKMNSLVQQGMYASKSEIMRDAVRRFMWEREVSTIALKGNSAELVRRARKQLSSQDIDLDSINSL